MNKAFTKDDDQGEPPLVPPRAPLPEGLPNYVTRRGLELLHREREQLELERADLAHVVDEVEKRRAAEVLAVRAAALAERIETAALIDPPRGGVKVVRFGARVRVSGEDGIERAYEIVGVDEADVAQGRIAFSSPLARAMMGKKVGAIATVKAPRGDEDLEVLDVSYEDP